MLGVGGVGLFCGRVHLQIRETKEKPRETKGNQGKTKEKPRETKEKPRETKETKKTPSINGSIFNQ